MERTIYTRKNEEVFVDEKNYDFLNKFTWHIDTHGYPRTSIKVDGRYKKVRMHNLLMPNDDHNKRVDHIDQNKLNNVEENLRICSHGQNMMNKSVYSNKSTSKYKGVYGMKKDGKVYAYRSKLTLNDREISIGCFTDEIASANAYNHFAKLLHGDFAGINDVPYMSKDEWKKFETTRSSQNKVGNWIMTYAGKHFYLLDPRVEDIDKLDIAHALSNYARFTGHTKYFYSVGTHSILCAEQARKDGMSAKIQLYLLLHDATEAYIGDMARPLKEFFPTFCLIEDEIHKIIFEHFGLPQPTEDEWKTIKHYDNFLLANEIGQLMINQEDFEIKPIYDGQSIPRFGNVHVENRFLQILEFLLKEYKEENK